jgi:predicted transcriptional regulator
MTAWRASTGAPGLAVGLAREFDGSSSPSFVTYTVYIQDRTVPKTSEVLTIRVPPDLGRRLAREARRQRRTRSDVARQLLDRALSSGPVEDPDTEAKRQSRLAADRDSEAEVLEFIVDTADLRGWQ